MSWIDTAKASITARDVATRYLGMRSKLNGMGPCPHCNAEKRGSEDPRLPVTVDREGKGWKCWACNESGDAIDLVARKVLGRSCGQLDATGWEELRKWALEHRLINETTETHDRRRSGAPASGVKSVGEILGTSKPKRKLGGRAPPPDRSEEEDRPVEGPGGARLFAWDPELARTCHDFLTEPDAMVRRVREYLTQDRKLSIAALDAFGIGIYVVDGKPVLNAAGRPYVTIPLVDAERRVVNVRFRSVPVVGTCQECDSPLGCRKCKEYRVCKGRPLPLFGAGNLTADKGSPVIVIEGEFDVLAMWSYGFQVNVVSGSGGAGTWEEDWTNTLEPYDRIIGLYDDDDAGRKGWAKVAEALGHYRCETAVLPENDANDCLIKGLDEEIVHRAVQRAKPMHGIEVCTVDHFADDLEELIEHPERLRGTNTGSKRLNDALGGFRPGVIVWTGESGKGKTTATTWLMYMQAKMGIPALITSFEQEPIGTVQKLLRIQVQQDFTRVSKERRREALTEMADMPLYILKHRGAIDPAKLVEVMRYSSRRLGVKQILIDHLGFLIDPDAKDERIAIQAVARALALVAKPMGITIHLVVHPRDTKEIPGKWSRVTMKDLKGASSIRQDADDVIVVTREDPNWEKGHKVKRPWPQARLFLDKVRSEFGSAGTEVALAFDPGACTYADEWDDTPAGRNGFLVPRSSPYHEQEEKRQAAAAARPDGSPRRRRSLAGKAATEGTVDPDADPGV